MKLIRSILGRHTFGLHTSSGSRLRTESGYIYPAIRRWQMRYLQSVSCSPMLVLIVLLLPIITAQAETALTYQPALGDYQRFKQDHGQNHMPHSAHSDADHDHAAHKPVQPDSASQRHEVKTHEQHHAHDHAAHEQE